MKTSKKSHVLITLLFIVALFSSTFYFSSCEKENLSPARKLTGTWKTPVAVTFYYYTDLCGVYQKVANVKKGFTWKITKISDNKVDIEWNHVSTSATQTTVSASCDGHVPMVTPKFLTGTISSSQMDIFEDTRNVGTLSFTTDNMAGYYYYGNECIIYCTGVGTNSAIPRAPDEKTLILQKQ